MHPQVLGARDGKLNSHPQHSVVCLGLEGLRIHSGRASQSRGACPESWIFVQQRKESCGRSSRSACFGKGGGGTCSRWKEQQEQRLKGSRWGGGWDWEESRSGPSSASGLSLPRLLLPGLHPPLSCSLTPASPFQHRRQKFPDGTVVSAGDRNTHIGTSSLWIHAGHVHTGGGPGL